MGDKHHSPAAEPVGERRGKLRETEAVISLGKLQQVNSWTSLPAAVTICGRRQKRGLPITGPRAVAAEK